MPRTLSTFSSLHPTAYHAFCHAGWSGINYAQQGNGHVNLRGVDPTGQPIDVLLPGVTGERRVITDSEMLRIMEELNVPLPSLIGVDYLDFLNGWRFYPSEQNPNELYEKRHPTLPSRKLYFDLRARLPDDTLLFVVENGTRTEGVRLHEVDNIYKVGEYLTRQGWFI